VPVLLTIDEEIQGYQKEETPKRKEKKREKKSRMTQPQE